MRMIWALCAGLMAAPVWADSLADIKQDVSVLAVELQKLKRELSTSQGAGSVVAGSQLDRINAIEAELMRVTAKTEELEYKIAQIVRDGTNRVGDLQFRICELEPGCDIGALGRVDPLGGVVQPQAPGPAVPAVAGSDLPLAVGELAVSEEADFLAARDALAAGDATGAAQLFAQFREIYPMGPLEAAALVGEGKALDALGDTREAARRFLAVYSGFPDSAEAPEALFRLGEALAGLDSVPEACVTLGEVAARYPGSDFVAAARDSRAELGCS